jgi:hypothetical protein
MRKSNGNKLSTKRKRTENTQVVRYTPSVLGFPNKLVTKLRYADYVNLAVTSGALAKYAFRWNSMFDPDFTSSGHQPLYRDQYAAVYNFYSVIAARAKITFTNTDVDNPYLVGAVTDEDATASTSFQTLMEQSNGTFQQLTALSGSRSMVTLNRTWSAISILGIDPYESAGYRTAIGDNPSNDSFLIIWAQIEDGSSSGSLGVTVEIEYDVLWSELLTPSQN